MEQPKITQIKYKKTSCYFCNEWFDNGNFKAHIEVCGQVLQKCPNHCASYVQRKHMEKHVKQCSVIAESDKPERNKSATAAAAAVGNNLEPIKEDKENEVKQNSGVLSKRQDIQIINDDNDFDKRCFILEQNVNALRSALQEEIRQRHRLITDVGELRKQHKATENWQKKIGDILSTLKQCLNDETESRCIDVKNCKEDIDNLIYQFQEIKEWRRELRLLLDHIQRELEFRDDFKTNLDILFGDNCITVSKIKAMEKEIEGLKQYHLRHQFNKSIENLENIVDCFQRSSTNSDNVPVLRNTMLSMSSATHRTIDVVKFDSLTLEVAQMKNIVTESEDKCDKIEKTINSIQKNLAITRQDLRDFQVHFRQQKKFSSIVNTTGHLIWRIDNYSEKLIDAKENGILIKSPMFCNTPYGYTLRLDVSLNGIGTWKGRNLLACLSVVGGEWDTLLTWPCKLQADIILKDQPTNLVDAKDVSKMVSVKKRSAAYEQNQYIFISHKTIATNNYVKNDAIIFEIKIQ